MKKPLAGSSSGGCEQPLNVHELGLRAKSVSEVRTEVCMQSPAHAKTLGPRVLGQVLYIDNSLRIHTESRLEHPHLDCPNRGP